MNRTIFLPSSDYKKFKEHLVSPLHWIELFMEKVLLTIEVRQSYCDRGQFLVKAWSYNMTPEDDRIDHQDGFPRYYFDFDCMLIELSKWLERRKQKSIIKIKYATPEEFDEEGENAKKNESGITGI